MSGGSSSYLNFVFYAENYHPIQAGSIDGTDIIPHDNAIYIALLCSFIGLCYEYIWEGEKLATGEGDW
ncbi:hypothetical protein MRB53_026596 [Persea americana]|uniref:Uncharacterized protein n=1 Tax=Persea americana TaxID=3435 RepID=A0ACC2LJ23_PERAE|nr:hypothetical protein MRB53_026596 [Persea americana]